MTHETKPKSKCLELGEDFRITSIKKRNVAGSWVFGILNGHQFQALVFPEHAEVESYELGQSRISKLWLQELATQKTVYIFERGEDCAAATGLASDIVDFLVSGLAEAVYGN